MFRKIKEVWESLEPILHYAVHSVALLLVSIVLVGKDVLPEAIAHALDEKKLLEILFVLTSSSFLLALGTLASHIRSSKGARFEVTPLNMTIAKALDGAKCREIKVYAISSRYIQSYLTATQFRCQHAKVLLWAPQETMHGSDVAEGFSREIDQVIRAGWGSSATRNIIASGEIRRYLDVPDIYFILFDDTHAVFGFYARTMQPDTVVEFSPALLVERSNDESAVILDWLKRHFDSMWDLSGKYWTWP